MKKLTLALALALTLLTLWCVTGCSSLSAKAVGIASNGTAIKIETTGSATSGTVLPNLLIGTVQNSIATAPIIKDGEKTQVVVSYTESQSALSAVFGHTAVTRTFSYVGLPAETADQTKARLDAVAKVLTANSVGNSPSASTGTSPTATTSPTGTSTAGK